MGIRHEPEGAQMTRPTAKPDLATSHYTRVSGTGEAGRKATPVLGRMHQPSLKEATMLRICTTLALIALTTSAAQAGTLAQRIHDAAVKACAVESVPEMNRQSHYRAITDHCVYRLSRQATAKYEAIAKSNAKAADRIANN